MVEHFPCLICISVQPQQGSPSSENRHLFTLRLHLVKLVEPSKEECTNDKEVAFLCVK